MFEGIRLQHPIRSDPIRSDWNIDPRQNKVLDLFLQHALISSPLGIEYQGQKNINSKQRVPLFSGHRTGVQRRTLIVIRL